jgi:hypothetical protein
MAPQQPTTGLPGAVRKLQALAPSLPRGPELSAGRLIAMGCCPCQLIHFWTLFIGFWMTFLVMREFSGRACVLLVAAYTWRFAGHRREFLAGLGDFEITATKTGPSPGTASS